MDDIKKLTVGVLMGGPSAEREISLKSGRAVTAALRSRGVRVLEIGEKEEVAAGIESSGIDLAFIALHGRFGEDGQVQSLLEARGIPYTGSGVEASRLALHKVLSRRRFEAAGLAVPPYRVIGPGEEIGVAPFPGSVVVKPSSEGSSIGLSIVGGGEEYRRACAAARRYDREIIAEKYLPGQELTVGVLEERALPVIKIVPRKLFFDFEAKYTRGMTDFILPAPLPPDRYREVQEAGLRAHRALGCYAYSRADIILGEDGVPYVLEVNTIPGFTATSLFPRAAAAAGVEFPDLCLKLMALALLRCGKLLRAAL
ncbi:MAG: D-alanine--D-alanine ligase [Candidatus Aureabacteria bacterium]|nr:D-alanine--D-alanine ligase [Candidatus Auribacterota bacterium]